MARVYQREDWAMHPTRQSGEWEGGDANVTLILHESIGAGRGPRHARRERDFGIGYGRSSGYGRTSYVRAWRPGVFTVR